MYTRLPVMLPALFSLVSVYADESLAVRQAFDNGGGSMIETSFSEASSQAFIQPWLLPAIHARTAAMSARPTGSPVSSGDSSSSATGAGSTARTAGISSVRSAE